MAKNLLNKYVWLVETIYKAKQISFDDICKRWLDNDMSEGKPMSIRTFHKWRIAIEEMFGLIIDNEHNGQYRYYIQNEEELKNGSMRSWLFNTLTVSNLMMNSVSIKDKVLFEKIPEGEQYLPDILKALKKNKVLEITYQGFSRDKAYTFDLEPYCLKAFKQRWYLIGRNPYNDQIKIYALDRVRWLWMTDKGFKYPEDFVPGEFFEDSYGIIADRKIDAETVVMRVSTKQANYLRSLPLHHTQKEIERTNEYSIFTVHLRPTFDFRQEILSYGCDIEVLSPKWFCDEIAEISEKMYNKYHNLI